MGPETHISNKFQDDADSVGLMPRIQIVRPLKSGIFPSSDTKKSKRSSRFSSVNNVSDVGLTHQELANCGP